MLSDGYCFVLGHKCLNIALIVLLHCGFYKPVSMDVKDRELYNALKIINDYSK